MALSETQWRTLGALCDTLIPNAGDQLPARVVEALSTSGNPADLVEFRQVLNLIESPAAAALLEGRFRRFTSMDREGREEALRRWANHPLPLLRKAFQAVKRLAGFLYSAGADSPLWADLEYPGHDRRLAAESRLRVEPLTTETGLEADAVVVGSGAGGGVIAAALAQRGLHVIVLEKGDYHPEAALGQTELEGMQQLYLDRGMTATRDLSVAILAGSAVGGGTLVNWTAAIAPPDWLRAEWEQEHGLTGLTSAAFQQCVDDVLTRLGVHADLSASQPTSSAGRLLAGCQALGYHRAEVPRNVADCGEDCGFCTFGCRTGAKQSTARTYLADAVAAGARVVPGATVRRVLVLGGHATGVEAEVNGRTVIVRAPRVILAAGALETPAIMLRSGMENPNIGRHLHLHPVAAVTGTYDEPIRPWSGRLLPAYCREFAHLDGNYGFLLEVAPAHPGIGALALPWRSGGQYRQDLVRLKHSAAFIALVRDRGSGQVTINRQGRRQIDYPVSPYDRKHLVRGQQELIRIHAAAGARSITTGHACANILEAVTPPSAAAFADGLARLPSGPNQLLVFSAHQMGTARLGRSRAQAVADETGQVFGVKGLYVGDASAFPAASGVNPMVTIMSLARWISQHIQ